VEHAVFRVASALRVPVLILALAALVVVLFELGAFAVELGRRRRRSFQRLETAVGRAQEALAKGDDAAAHRALAGVAWSRAMGSTLSFLVGQLAQRRAGERMAKGLADFDFRSLRRLERTRMLVRAGPALGLMGTLIPLSPALAGLASGNVRSLSDNLRVAFSVTVLGLLVGAIAFAISLVRDRLYSQDLSDLEYVAATIAPEHASAPVVDATSPVASSDAPPAASPDATPAASSDAILATPPKASRRWWRGRAERS
jgi:biopolymer transport protein ExbB/TolQ